MATVLPDLKLAWDTCNTRGVSATSLANDSVRNGIALRKTYGGMMTPPNERERKAIAQRPKNTEVIVMTAGKPDKNLLAYEEVMQYLKLAWEQNNPAPMEYGASQQLRDEIAKYLTRTRGCEVRPSEVQISSGNGDGLRMVMEAYLGPGDIVLVESPLWTMTVNLIADRCATPVAVGADSEGICMSDIEKEISIAKRYGKRVKAIYVQPLHHNPTGVTITRERAESLLRLAAEHGIIIICDEPYEAFSFHKKPCYLSALSAGLGVFTVHTFSKTLGTGLRLGYVHAAEEWLAPMRQLLSIRGSIFLEYGVGALMASGRFDDIVARAKEVYARKMLCFCDALHLHAGRHLAVKPIQEGGFFVWLELAKLSAVEVNLELLQRGVEARIGKNMHGPNHEERRTSGGLGACHIGFAYIGPSEAQLAEAAKRFGAACDAVEAGHRQSAL